MAQGALRGAAAARQICSRVDAHLRKMAAGPANAPQQLHREILYLLAGADGLSPAGEQVRALYQLEALLPDPDATLCDQPLGPLLGQLRGLFAEARDTWDRFAGGLAVALPQFEVELARTMEAGSALGRPAFRRLLGKLSEVVSWLREDPLRFDEALALEVASAIMLAETALDTGRVPDAAFTSQVVRCELRLDALIGRGGGQACEPSGLPDAVLGPGAHGTKPALPEMQVNLAQIEQTLDDFFRRPERRSALPGLQAPLKQIEGALNLLGEARAVTLLQDCAARIAGLAQGVAESESEDYEYLAHHLSALGFFIADLQRGHADLDRLLGSDEPVAQEDETFEAPAVREHRADTEAAPAAPQPEPESFVAAEGEEAPKPGEVPAEEISPPSTAAPLQAPPSEQLLAASDSEIDAGCSASSSKKATRSSTRLPKPRPVARQSAGQRGAHHHSPRLPYTQGQRPDGRSACARRCRMGSRTNPQPLAADGMGANRPAPPVDRRRTAAVRRLGRPARSGWPARHGRAGAARRSGAPARDSDMPLCDAAPLQRAQGRDERAEAPPDTDLASPRKPCPTRTRPKPSKRPKRSSRPTPALTWLTSSKASGPRISPRPTKSIPRSLVPRRPGEAAEGTTHRRCRTKASITTTPSTWTSIRISTWNSTSKPMPRPGARRTAGAR